MQKKFLRTFLIRFCINFFTLVALLSPNQTFAMRDDQEHQRIITTKKYDETKTITSDKTYDELLSRLLSRYDGLLSRYDGLLSRKEREFGDPCGNPCPRGRRYCDTGPFALPLAYNPRVSRCFKCGAREFFREDLPEFFREDLPEFFETTIPFFFKDVIPSFFKSLPDRIPIIRGCVAVHKARREEKEALNDFSFDRYKEARNKTVEASIKLFGDFIEYGPSLIIKGIKGGSGIYSWIKK